MLNSTGYEEISLLSLSTGDYSGIEPLLSSLMGNYCDKRIAVSLPSLRPETLSQSLIEEIRKVRKTSFTIAPEAGTERLRRLINKGNTEEDLIAAAERVFAAGWRSIKLYFMIGLPEETEEDLQGIVELAEKVAHVGSNRRQVTVSISSFVPKPHTPFQWQRQIGRHEIAEKQQFLKSRLRNRNISLKWHNSAMSLLEGVISRGDEKIAGLIEKAWFLGARFDGWSDLLNMEIWDEALRQCSIYPDNYLRQRHVSERQPWDNIDCGVSREFLIDELEKSKRGELTSDCRTATCADCGACPDEHGRNEPQAVESEENMIKTTAPSIAASAEKAQRYGLKYSKEGKSRFISHLDTAAVLARAIRRAGVLFNFSGGFHPHPKVSFACALPVGVESCCEYAEVEVCSPGFEQCSDAINCSLPEGMRVLGMIRLEKNSDSMFGRIRGYRYNFILPDGYGEKAVKAIDHFLAANEFFVRRDLNGKKAQRDIRPLVKDLGITGSKLTASLMLGEKGGVRPSEVLVAIVGLSPEQARNVAVRKTDILL